MIQFPSRFPVNFRDSSGKDHKIHSPNDHELITTVQYANSQDIEHLLNLLPLAQKKMAALKAHERSAILKKVAKIIQENTSKLAWLISTEGGKPLKDAKVEVARAQITFELCAEEALRLGGETLPMERTKAGENHLAFTTREPIGPVLAISAFNHPLNLLAHQIGTAVASGCAVVVKPAPSTPLCAFKLEKYFQEAGLPTEGLFVVNAEIAEIEMMASSSRFKYVSFIGSAKVGWHLRKILAPGTRLSLEHGGEAFAMIREDADLTLAVPALIKGAFYHAGQVCISTQRIFVHHSLYQKFLETFSTYTQKLVTGSAVHENTDVGPLIRPSEVTRIQSWIDEALQKGAKLICGNEVSGNREQYLSPTILAEVPPQVKIMTEEVFGPVVCVNSYSDEEKLLEYLNSNQDVFENCIFTQDITQALRLSKAVKGMTVVINDHSAYRVDWMPFGGHDRSGLGMGGVRYAMEEMAPLKQTIIKY